MGLVGVAPGTTTFTLPDGTTVALGDWIDNWLYGTIQLVNGQTNQLVAFSNGRAQPIPGGTRIQTRVDTNIPRAGDAGLPKDWRFLVYALAIKMVRATRGAAPLTNPANLASFSDPIAQRTFFEIDRVTFFEYRYNDKHFAQGTCQEYPQGSGLNLVTTNPSREQVTNGVPSPRDRASMVLPIDEREGLSYQGVFTPESALAIAQAASDGGNALDFVDLKLYKCGLIRRTVV